MSKPNQKPLPSSMQLVDIFRASKILQLNAQRQLMIEYLNMKIAISDWHGVADAAMDLREIDAMLGLLNAVQKERLEQMAEVKTT